MLPAKYKLEVPIDEKIPSLLVLFLSALASSLSSRRTEDAFIPTVSMMLDIQSIHSLIAVQYHVFT